MVSPLYVFVLHLRSASAVCVGGLCLSPSYPFPRINCYFWAFYCQTRIGIGVTQRISHFAIGLILEFEVTVIVDQYQCVKTDVSPKYRRS